MLIESGSLLLYTCQNMNDFNHKQVIKDLKKLSATHLKNVAKINQNDKQIQTQQDMISELRYYKKQLFIDSCIAFQNDYPDQVQDIKNQLLNLKQELINKIVQKTKSIEMESPIENNNNQTFTIYGCDHDISQLKDAKYIGWCTCIDEKENENQKCIVDLDVQHSTNSVLVTFHFVGIGFNCKYHQLRFKLLATIETRHWINHKLERSLIFDIMNQEYFQNNKI